MKYTAINIGPIVDTLMMVRKPRQLWCASFLFSHIMSRIIEITENKDGKLISPAKAPTEKTGIGLYPDRAFFTSDNELPISEIINEVFSKLKTDLGYNLSDYINIMSVSYNSENEAIIYLNKKLDALELSKRSQPNVENIKDIISNKKSPLFELGFEKKDMDNICIANIASIRFSQIDKKIYNEALKELNKNKDKADDEDSFYKKIKESFHSEDVKSHHKYFCVVQADGDNMGKVIANLQEGKLSELSGKLIDFGQTAVELIKNAGGLPIYAGGDDLLFLAPVICKDGNTILDLIDGINTEYANVNQCAQELQNGNRVETSMSYGVAISYYKYPLYEALACARNLLFGKAKNFEYDKNGKPINKNAIAISLNKHSGSSLTFTYSNSDKEVSKAFKKLTTVTSSETLVSAVAHKLREGESLLQSIGNNEERLKAYFVKFLGLGEKSNDETIYLNAVKDLLKELLSIPIYINQEDKNSKTELSGVIYSILRITKFINGEGLKDE